MTITTTGTCPWHTPHTYEIVDKIPTGFFVWNIGANMSNDEYIPLCQSANTGICDIRTDTLKAIKLDKRDVMILRKAAAYGVNDRTTAKAAMNREAKSQMQKTKKQLAEKAFPIFEKIS